MMSPTGGGGGAPQSAAAAAESQGAINIVNSDGSINPTGAFILALTGVGFFLVFLFVAGLLAWLLQQVRSRD
jgi:hypothetical protein